MADSATLETIKASAPRSNFPQSILTMAEVSAPNTSQLQYIAQYNQAAMTSNWTKCKQILETAKADSSAGDLSACKITSEGFNTLVDEIKAVEIYYNTEMENYFAQLLTYIDRCAQNALGLDDYTSSVVTSYSSAKIDEKLAAITTIIELSLPVKNWKSNDDGTYTMTVDAPNITTNSYPMWYLKGTPTAEEYESFCYISSMETGDSQVTFTCTSDVPTVDLSIMVKGY